MFNETNCCQISPTTEKLLFGIIPSCKETKLINKFNYTTLCAIAFIQTKSIVSVDEAREPVDILFIPPFFDTSSRYHDITVFFFNFLFAILLTKIYNTLHYLHYSHYLQHSTILRFLSLLHAHRTREKKTKKKGKKLPTTFVL